MTKQEEILTQSVLVDDLLITLLRDREYAERLMIASGVRLHFDIPWDKMPYWEHYRDNEAEGNRWNFSSKPFKEEIKGSGE